MKTYIGALRAREQGAGQVDDAPALLPGPRAQVRQGPELLMLEDEPRVEPFHHEARQRRGEMGHARLHRGGQLLRQLCGPLAHLRHGPMTTAQGLRLAQLQDLRVLDHLLHKEPRAVECHVGLAGRLPVDLETWVATAAAHTHFAPEGVDLILAP